MCPQGPDPLQLGMQLESWRPAENFVGECNSEKGKVSQMVKNATKGNHNSIYKKW